MSLLTAVELSKSFGPNDLFTGLSLSIPQRARIGLVGPNGVGKTTLVRVLLGLEEATGGEVQRSRNLQIGYLPQEAALDSPRTLWEECLTVFDDLRKQQAELRRLEDVMAAGPANDNLLDSYGKRQQEFERLGGYTYETRIRQTLAGLGFERDDLRRPLAQLSGGQRTRALLAKLLLAEPELLVLDEPTNHLDIAAVEWLENYLREWKGAVLIVSHDRYFLDQVVQTIWEMTPALEEYHGNYSAYMRQREERYARRLEEYQAQIAFIEKEEEYIRRNIAGQNTRQAQGRRKRLERLLAEARLTPPVQSRRLHLQLEPAARSGDLVLRTYGLSVGYVDEPSGALFSVPDLTLTRGECAAIIGPNGAGKTTMLKTLLGEIPPLAGQVELGASLQIGYFAQAHEGLHSDQTLMSEIESVAPQMRPGEVRDYLAKFLFTGDDAFKPVSALSGGERGRLALARLALQGANLLLLDEPTNHLDLAAQEALQSILSAFGGTILLVSHDRYLIDALATQVWEVLPEPGTLHLFDGTYSEYKAYLAAQQEEVAQSVSLPARATPDRPAAVEERSRQRSGLNNNERRRQQQMQQLEHDIEATEAQITALERTLENPPADPGEVARLGQEYQRLQTQLDERMAAWGELAGA
ncbi:protein containg ATPase component of ABC transporter with duplicated ATPase domains [Longilinea arvoryzae]|uniref:Protein containg ATPase component of ABC transporter with duplicated ATPase domains n=1 Tax=Longilinea arvoryzae TaxID=360412 RepID=A0A0S7BGK6_9CHLR|nr:ABC-F family ATP-binding cassette domain-containing protein [Longilinea arvoryzae]GAP12945.1 protein containg ATPase component of ABC transporter with duplicated ATPase domains [Longilinea arvoryzae]